ncbi:MAG TPA: TetR family transcriptional regulator [Actinomycetota bacterium]|nr:TetR family transcriptional regulator [Actinomycetota bacterium]
MDATEDAEDLRPGLRERKKQQTRERLIASALTLFREVGYDAATVEAIAEDADVSVTTFFRYFESKEDVFLSTVEPFIARIQVAILDRPPKVSVVRALKQVMQELLTEIDHEDVRAEQKEIDEVPELRERIREYEDRIRRTIAEAYGEQLGEPPASLRPRMLAEAVVGSIEAARTSWVQGPRNVPLEDHMADALDLADRMTRPLLRKGHFHPG